MFSYELSHMDVPVLANQQRLTNINLIWTQDATKKTCQGMNVLSVQLDDDNNIYIYTYIYIYIYIKFFVVGPKRV